MPLYSFPQGFQSSLRCLAEGTKVVAHDGLEGLIASIENLGQALQVAGVLWIELLGASIKLKELSPEGFGNLLPPGLVNAIIGLVGRINFVPPVLLFRGKASYCGEEQLGSPQLNFVPPELEKVGNEYVVQLTAVRNGLSLRRTRLEHGFVSHLIELRALVLTSKEQRSVLACFNFHFVVA